MLQKLLYNWNHECVNSGYILECRDNCNSRMCLCILFSRDRHTCYWYTRLGSTRQYLRRKYHCRNDLFCVINISDSIKSIILLSVVHYSRKLYKEIWSHIPSSHWQSKLPIVLVQVALEWQLCRATEVSITAVLPSIAHSSTSSQSIPSPENPQRSKMSEIPKIHV